MKTFKDMKKLLEGKDENGLTHFHVKQHLRTLPHVTGKRTDYGEWRITHRGLRGEDAENLAYYTTDHKDAINTATHMNDEIEKTKKMDQISKENMNKFENWLVKRDPEMLDEKNWIAGAFKDVKKRGTEGVCSGANYGGKSCPVGSKRYNMAKTMRKIAKKHGK